MGDDNLAARFARTIRDLLVLPPVVPDFDDAPNPEIARIEWAIACLPKRTRDVFLMHRFEDQAKVRGGCGRGAADHRSGDL